MVQQFPGGGSKTDHNNNGIPYYGTVVSLGARIQKPTRRRRPRKPPNPRYPYKMTTMTRVWPQRKNQARIFFKFFYKCQKSLGNSQHPTANNSGICFKAKIMKIQNLSKIVAKSFKKSPTIKSSFLEIFIFFRPVGNS